MEIVLLEEKTNLVKHYEKATIKNILQIGKILKEINENHLYKAKYDNFVEYIKHNFKFGKSYAYSFIGLYEKYGEDFQRLEKIEELGGMRFVILSIRVENDRIDQIIHRIDDKDIKSPEQFIREVNRFKGQIGKDKNDPNEQRLLALRQGHNICDQIDSLKETIEREIIQWNVSNTRFFQDKEVYELKVKLDTKLGKIIE